MAVLLTVCFPSHGGGPELPLNAALLHPPPNTLRDGVMSQPGTRNDSDLLQRHTSVHPGSHTTVEFVCCFFNKINQFLQAQRAL